MEQNKHTAVEALFAEFRALAKGMRDAQDFESANLIDFLCEREPAVREWEKNQILDAVDSVQLVNRYYSANGEITEDLLGQEITTDKERTYIGLSTTGEKYYNETYGGNK